MKSISRLFAVASLSLAGLVSFAGCVTDNSPTPETTGIEAAPEATVVRYTAADIAALAPGELLGVDLNLPNTIYAVTYADPASLDRVLVMQGDSHYILGDRAPATAKDQSTTQKQLILTGDMVVDPGSGESVAPPSGNEQIGTAQEAVTSNTIVSCLCPCCIQVAGHLVCCTA
jgi:hypothetical protein